MNKSEIVQMLKDGLTVRVPASQIFQIIDHFWDCGEPECPDESVDEMIARKQLECHDEFIESIRLSGIAVPCEVEVHRGGKIWMENGHHRVSVALLLDIDIPLTTQNVHYSIHNEGIQFCGS